MGTITPAALTFIAATTVATITPAALPIIAATAVGTITAAVLTIIAAADSKVYDGTTSATAMPSVSGLVGSDTVTGLSEAYASKDVTGANGGTMVLTGYTVNDGNSGNDYTVSTATGTSTARASTATITAAGKTYARLVVLILAVFAVLTQTKIASQMLCRKHG